MQLWALRKVPAHISPLPPNAKWGLILLQARRSIWNIMKLERVEWEYKEMSPSSAWQMVHRTTWFYYTLSNIPNFNSRANKHANVYIYIAWNVHNPVQKLECNCYDQAIRENKINPKHRAALLTSSLLCWLLLPQKLFTRPQNEGTSTRNLKD